MNLSKNITINKKVCYFLIVLLITIIILVSIGKVIIEHQEKIKLVESKLILETAQKCVVNNDCHGDKVTLKMLYDNKYLDKEYNKITKEYYNENSYVDLKTKKFIVK